jgi:hypothetical protein
MFDTLFHALMIYLFVWCISSHICQIINDEKMTMIMKLIMIYNFNKNEDNEGVLSF